MQVGRAQIVVFGMMGVIVPAVIMRVVVAVAMAAVMSMRLLVVCASPSLTD